MTVPLLPDGHDVRAAEYNRLIQAATADGLVYYGPTTGWKPSWNLPWGAVYLGSNFDGTTSGTTVLALGATGTVVQTYANRRYEWRLGLDAGWFGSTVGDVYTVGLRETGQSLYSNTLVQVTVANAYLPPGFHISEFTATTGLHGYESIAQRSAGTGTLQFRGRMTIHDIGPAGAAPTS
jgi:hypothetical protein